MSFVVASASRFSRNCCWPIAVARARVKHPPSSRGMTTFIIATRNPHKVEEIRGILGASFHFLTLRDFPNAPAVIEDADTFAGNATKKAVELARWLAGVQSP